MEIPVTGKHFHSTGKMKILLGISGFLDTYIVKSIIFGIRTECSVIIKKRHMEVSCVMTAEERVTALHAKMEKKIREREHQFDKTLGVICTGLSLCLLLLIFGGTAEVGSTAGMYSGATILFENAGAYVVTAVIAFMAGVLITVILKKYKAKDKEKPEQETEEQN